MGDYKQVSLHFVKVRSEEYGSYLMYPIAKQAHSWIEPILLKIASRYNYSSGVPRIPGAGFVTSSFPRLMLARLGPGSTQMKHVDSGGSSAIPHKIHIPLS